MRPTLLPLTSARFFAAFFVLIFHFDRKHELFPDGLCDFGYQAVTFFFILSGFVLTYAHATVGGLNISTTQFWRARAARIVPTYWLALAISLPFVIGPILKGREVDPGLWLVPGMMQAWIPSASLLWNSPAWSLSNEAFFYALFPITWMGLGRMPLLSAVAAITSLVAISSYLHIALGGAYLPILNLPQFLLGVVLARIFLERGPVRGARIWLASSTAAIALVIVLKANIPWLGYPVTLCAVFSCSIFSLASLRGTALSSRPMVLLGDASYAQYILQAPLWLWLDRIVRFDIGAQLNPVVSFVMYCALVMSASITVHLWFEMPLKRLLTVRQIIIPSADSLKGGHRTQEMV